MVESHSPSGSALSAPSEVTPGSSCDEGSTTLTAPPHFDGVVAESALRNLRDLSASRFFVLPIVGAALEAVWSLRAALEKPLFLLFGLESGPSKLGTLRMVAVLARALAMGVSIGGLTLLTEPVEAGASFFVAGSSRACEAVGAALEANSRKDQPLPGRDGSIVRWLRVFSSREESRSRCLPTTVSMNIKRFLL